MSFGSVANDPPGGKADVPDAPQYNQDTAQTVSFSPAAPAGTEVGPYRLLQLIGSGGMGHVWLAEQPRPVRRRVAVKLIKPGMDTREVVARFESERQALALMDHPSIAKVFEAGSTPEGHPYFVMEYVVGIPITEYCDKHKLTTRDRLRLFMQVCEGVQHAHQKEIVHRDLKPSNILVCDVDDKPLAKIIDFGIAKAMAHQLTAQTMLTGVGAVIGTPGYMSPEQANTTGIDVDTRSDVYSLGVVLYQLLVGALPIEFDNSAFHESVRRLCEEDAPRPSTKLSSQGERSTTTARNRGVDPGSLVRLLRGDLDAIALKALEKERSRRYSTPMELAADLSRWLRHEPVTARRASAAYQARKYVRRHRIGVAMTALGLVLLVSFSILQAIQMQRLRRERDRANRITDFMTEMFRVSDPRVAQGNTITARAILDKASAQIETELGRDPELRVQLMNIMGKVYHSLGLYDRARTLLEGAVAINKSVVGPENRVTLRAQSDLAEVLLDNRPAESEKLLLAILEVQRRTLGTDDPDTIRSMGMLPRAVNKQSRYAEAEKQFRETLAISQRVFGPESPETLLVMYRLGGNLRDQGRYQEAEALIRQTLALRSRILGPEHRDTIESMSSLGYILVRQERFAEAEKILRDTVDAFRRVLGADHPDTNQAMHNLASAVQIQGRYQEAEKLYRQILESGLRLKGREHPDTLATMHNLAGTLSQQGRYQEAERMERETRNSFLRVLGPDHPDTASSTYQLSSFVARLGRREEALGLLRHAIEHGLYPWVNLAIADDPDLASLRGDPRFTSLVEEAKKRAAAASSTQ